MPLSLRSGEQKTIYVPLSASGCRSGDLYRYQISMTYDDPSTGAQGLKQEGTRDLVGKCA